MTGANREFEIVVYGATGFSGRLVVEYLLDCYGVGGTLRWAIAGRSANRLSEVATELGVKGIPVIVADSNDSTAMKALAARTRVVCTTVGPYAKYGTELLAACVEQGSHYCDLTGELYWMRRMIDVYQGKAEQSGARIVYSCGFDSIPSDLGTLSVQNAMFDRYGVRGKHVKYRIVEESATVSGGTIASAVNMIEEKNRDPQIQELMDDPYVLNPPNAVRGPDGLGQTGAIKDSDFDQWTAPNMMEIVNSRVVRRTNALLNYPWSQDFRYDEAILTGAGARGFVMAKVVAAGTALMLKALEAGPLRKLLLSMTPKPGEGPSKEAQEKGRFEIAVLALHPETSEKNLQVTLKGDRDAYGATAIMLAESAVCLAKDELAVGGGFWTPASAMGEMLLKRLTASGVMTYSLN